MLDAAPPEWGPAPTPATPALPAARARVASALAETGSPVTLAALAARLGGHPNATRAHLDQLVADGHAATTRISHSGRGRPPVGYRLTASGRRALTGDPTREVYAELVSAMASDLSEGPDAPQRALAIGRRWGTRREDRPSREHALTMLADLGFDPDAAGAVVRLRTCPILGAAAAHPDVVCAIHAGLIEGASGEPTVRLLPFAEPGACRVEFG